MSNKEKCFNYENTGRTITEEIFGKWFEFFFTEEQYNRIDFKAVRKKDGKQYTGEIKCYRNPQYPRNHNKFIDYQIDYDKCKEIVEGTKEDGSTPLIIAHFTDCTMTWDLTCCDWENRGEWRECNKHGYDYGKEKELSYETHLLFDEAIYIKDNRTGMTFTNYQNWKSWMEDKKAS